MPVLVRSFFVSGPPGTCRAERLHRFGVGDVELRRASVESAWETA